MDVSQDFTDNPRMSLRHLRGIGHKLSGSGRKSHTRWLRCFGLLGLESRDNVEAV